MISSATNNHNNVQQKLIHTLEHLNDEKQLAEIDSLINFYFEQKLDEAISKAEAEHNFSEVIYECWLKEQKTSNKQ